MSKCIPPELVAQLKERLQKNEITPDVINGFLPEEKAALKSLLQEFVADKLKVSVSDKEIAEIQVKAKKIEEAQAVLGDDVGNPAKVDENIAFFKAKKEMEDYLLSKSPAGIAKVVTGTFGRGMMLLSVKSPLLNIGSNIEIALAEVSARRISRGELQSTDNKMAVDYVKFANKLYQETGYDISRMTSLRDLGQGGERVLGQTVHAQGPTIKESKGVAGKTAAGVRFVSRIVEDVVFKQLMGAPDVAFASAHYADSVNLGAFKLAKGDKATARTYMEDAMRLEPKTEQGQILRDQAILDSQVATWTNNSWATRVSESIRKILNDVSGDARLGDYLLPFIRTPANVIATGMQYAGLGIPSALFKTFKAFKAGDVGSKAHLQSISTDIVRSGLGIAGALVLTTLLSNNDFVGAYDPQRAQIEQLRNSNYNAIRIRGKWVSVDWLGPLAVPVTAVMYARKYGKTGSEQVFQYGKAVATSALRIPGIADIYDTVKANAYKSNQTLEEATGSTFGYITQQVASRIIPSISSDLAKAFDGIVRDTSGEGINGIINPIKAKVPFLSKTLPEKKNVFGEPVKGENAISDILFGARVRTDRETPIVKEVSTVSNDTGKGINFTDWSKSSSKTLAQFKDKVGDAKYNEAKIKYGQELQKQLQTAFNSPQYKKLAPEEKLKVINAQDADAMAKVFRQYGFKYVAPAASKTPKL